MKEKTLAQLREAFVQKWLRKASLQWFPRTEAVRAARKQRGLHECAMCKSLVRRGEYILDHIDPVIPLQGLPVRPDGGRDWNVWIDRLLCPSSNFRLICKACDEAHTNSQKEMRKYYRKRKKYVDSKAKKR